MQEPNVLLCQIFTHQNEVICLFLLGIWLLCLFLSFTMIRTGNRLHFNSKSMSNLMLLPTAFQISKEHSCINVLLS